MRRATRISSTRARCWSGEGISYDTCRRRGVINDALTNFNEGSTVWFLRGSIAQDSSSSRIYAGSSDITSCDLPTPALPLRLPADEVGLPLGDGGAAGDALRARRPDPVAAVHLPGHAAGPALGDPDPPVRDQRPGPAHPGLQPAGHERRLLLGAQRLSRLHRPARLVRQPLRAVWGDGSVPLARPVRRRHGGVQRAAAGGRRIGARAPVGPPADLRPLHQPQPQLQLRQQLAGGPATTRSIRCRTPSRSPARSTSPSATAGAR